MIKEDKNRYDMQYSALKIPFPTDLYGKLFKLTRDMFDLEVLDEKEKRKIEYKIYRAMKYYRKI